MSLAVGGGRYAVYVHSDLDAHRGPFATTLTVLSREGLPMAKQRPHPGKHPESPMGSQCAATAPVTGGQAYAPHNEPLTPEQFECIRLLAGAQVRPTVKVISTLLDVERRD